MWDTDQDNILVMNGPPHDSWIHPGVVKGYVHDEANPPVVVLEADDAMTPINVGYFARLWNAQYPNNKVEMDDVLISRDGEVIPKFATIVAPNPNRYRERDLAESAQKHAPKFFKEHAPKFEGLTVYDRNGRVPDPTKKLPTSWIWTPEGVVFGSGIGHGQAMFHHTGVGPPSDSWFNGKPFPRGKIAWYGDGGFDLFTYNSHDQATMRNQDKAVDRIVRMLERRGFTPNKIQDYMEARRELVSPDYGGWAGESSGVGKIQDGPENSRIWQKENFRPPSWWTRASNWTRLDIARQLGLTHVPAVGYRGKGESQLGRGRDVSVEPMYNAFGEPHYPSSFKPSQLGMKTSNILDPIHPTLDQDVFNGMTPRMEIFGDHLHHIQEIFRQNNYDPTAFDFYLTGSLCTYQYSPTSDVDISIVCQVELSEEDRSDLIAIVLQSLDGRYFPGT